MGELVTDLLIDAYIEAREDVIANGYGSEIDWQDLLDFRVLTESDFLRETAWVVLNSGMKASVIRSKFPEITAAFLDWRSAEAIVSNCESCRRAAFNAFFHEGKINAIVSAACRVFESGFEQVKQRISEHGVNYLESLDYIGPVTRFHLAKNLGLDVVKPDRHLSRIAAKLGFAEPVDMCEVISRETGDRKAVVDVVIWRFATLRPEYLNHFAAAC